MLDTFRADHCPGFPPLSLLWTSFLISSLSSGSVYFSLGGIETAEGFKLVVKCGVVKVKRESDWLSQRLIVSYSSNPDISNGVIELHHPGMLGCTVPWLN